MARVPSPVFHQLSILRHHAPYRQQLETESLHMPHGNLIGQNGVGFARKCRDQWSHLPIFVRASMARRVRQTHLRFFTMDLAGEAKA